MTSMALVRKMAAIVSRQQRPALSAIISSSTLGSYNTTAIRDHPGITTPTWNAVRPFSTSFHHHEEHFSAFQEQQQQQQQQQSHPGINPTPDLGMTSAMSLYRTKDLKALMRAWVSLSICQWQWLVNNAEILFKLSQSISKRATERLLEQTLYGHFCAGQDEHRIQPTMERLNHYGIGSILDYAAELDQDDAASSTPLTSPTTKTTSSSSSSSNATMEESFARNTNDFKKSIRAVSTMGSRGSCAVHLTAICSPTILEKFSTFLAQWQQLWETRSDENGQMEAEQLKALLHQLYHKEHAERVHGRLVENGIDALSWTSLLEPVDFVHLCPSPDLGEPLDVLDAADLESLMDFYRRGHELASEAKAMGTTLFVDAEHCRYQLAIDHLVWILQRKFNATASTSYPVVQGTFQCYRKDAHKRVQVDVRRSERFNYHFGAKIVRGAMMESEREYAAEHGLESPIHETLHDTHNCYNQTVEFLVQHAAVASSKTEVLVATHNKESILRTIEAMNKHGIDRSDGTIAFGQLFGMSDVVTHALAQNGYKVSKYLPYGEVEVSMPYLIRRAVENSSLASGATEELSLIRGELRRRIVGF